MSLDVTLMENGEEVYSANITHNLNEMAKVAGIYSELWRPEDVCAIFAKDIVVEIANGLKKMVENPAVYEKYNAPNGWGTYNNFLPWVAKYLRACRDHPNAVIYISR